jgi:tetratricopeptide (TPR) repeat protein
MIRMPAEERTTSSMVNILQKDLPLSRSFIWNLQAKYYQSLGIDAWLSGIVPSRVTTNSHIAWRYARLIASYIRDTQARNITIVELGAGHGRFGFLTATHLQQIAAESLPQDIIWKYVLTDCAERNIQFYESHEAFEPLLAEGKVDFARFEAGVDHSLQLRHSGEVIDAVHPTEHLIVIGNYFFDSLPMDVWHVKNGQLSTFWPKIHVRDSGASFTQDQPDVLEHLDLEWEHREAAPEYPSQLWNSIAAQLAEEIQNGTFMLPIGAFDCLEEINSWTEQPMFMLVTDKGYPKVADYQDRGPPTLIQHGCFSFNLNFVALQKWFEAKAGFAFLPSCRDGLIETAAFATHHSSASLSALQFEYSAASQFTPAEFHQVTRRCENASPDLFTALSFLKLSCYDPITLHRLRRNIRGGIPDADSIELNLLYDSLLRVRQNFYHLRDFDIPFDLGLIYQHLGDYDIAVDLYHESLRLFGESGITFFNLAICHEKLGQNAQALDCIDKSIGLDPDSDALEFRAKLQPGNLLPN